MLNVATRFDYSAENEAAKIATRNFDLILEKASEQYKKIWNKYLDLFKKYEAVTAEHEKIPETQKEKNICKSMQTSSKYLLEFPEQEFITNEWKEKKTNEKNENVIEHILKTYSLDHNSDGETTVLGNDSPKDSVFLRQDFSNADKNNTLISCDMKNNTHIGNDIKDISKKITNCNLNISSEIICNSPAGRNDQNKHEKNAINHEEEKSTKNKRPLQAIENTTLILDTIPKSNNERKLKRKGKQSPTKTMRQTKLLFHTPKMSMDDSDYMIPSSQETQSTCKNFPNCTELLRKNTSKLSEKYRTENLPGTYIDSGCIQDNTMLEDVIENTPQRLPDSKVKSRLKLKTKLSQVDKIESSIEKSPRNIEESGLPLNSTSLIFAERKTPNRSMVKENINCSSSTTTVAPGMSPLFISETINEDNENEQLCDQDLETSNTKQLARELKPFFVRQIFPKANTSQSSNEDETHFSIDENFVRANSTSSLSDQSRNAKSRKTNTKLISYKTDLSLSPSLKRRTPKKRKISSSGIDKPKNKSAKSVKEEAWSCWECAEYYKTKRGVSEEQLKMWKNQCSRHKNPHYAMKETPPGFWDLEIPDSYQSRKE